MILSMPSESLTKEDILHRAEEFGIDLSLLRERLKLSPTDRVEYHKRCLRSLESVVQEVKRARSRNYPQGSVRQ